MVARSRIEMDAEMERKIRVAREIGRRDKMIGLAIIMVPFAGAVIFGLIRFCP
jgi:hypothetical protein